jgi:hypothetical protein
MDHQMNLKLSEEFGQYFKRLPLKKSAKIVNANALRIDWADVIKPENCSYVLGNPPFVGAKFMDETQKQDMHSLGYQVKGYGLLDYVCAWYLITANFIRSYSTRAAFVSTNSIAQGEQAGILWNAMQKRHSHINFAYRSFPWKSEAKGKANVHVVIIGFCSAPTNAKMLYEYDESKNQTDSISASNISPFLVDGPNVFITNRTKPLSNAPEMRFGNQPIDGGFFIFSEEEKDEILKDYPAAEIWLRLFIGAEEFINNKKRWCLWLKGAKPDELRSIPPIMERIQNVAEFRRKSDRKATQELASTPTEFAFSSHTNSTYLLVPSVSSEKRKFIPMGFMPPTTIPSNLCLVIPNAQKFDFGVLSSTMHMAWMRLVAGRLESRYRYSAKLVYNNYPWPENPTEKQKANVESKAQAVLDARAKYPDSSLADLYDPLTMPPDLVKAHEQLDKAVEQCYRSKPFESDRERVEYLFQLYEQLTAPLTAQADKPKRTRKKKADDAE